MLSDDICLLASDSYTESIFSSLAVTSLLLHSSTHTALCLFSFPTSYNPPPFLTSFFGNFFPPTLGPGFNLARADGSNNVSVHLPRDLQLMGAFFTDQ